MLASKLQPVRVLLTLDSVCAGDDADAPHQQAFWEYCLQRDPDALSRLFSSAPARGDAP
jgi:hypothetical protein